MQYTKDGPSMTTQDWAGTLGLLDVPKQIVLL